MAELCPRCGFPIERTHPIALPLKEPGPAPKAAPSSPRPSRPSPAPAFDEPPSAGAHTVNERPQLERALTEKTHQSLEAIAAVLTTAPVPTVARPEPIAPAPVEATAPAAAPLPVATDSTRMVLEPVGVSSSETMLKLPEVAAGPRPAWPLVLLGCGVTAALIIGVAALFMPADEPAVAVVEEVPVPLEPQAEKSAAEAPKTDDGPAKEAPKASWGDPTERKSSFYPDHPTDNAKRGIVPSRTPPPRGVLRVVTVAHGNQVSAPLSVDHQPQGMTPKELKGLKPGVHLFEVVVSDGPPVQVHFPLLAATKQKNGDYLEIEIAQDGEVVQRTPAPLIGRSGQSADGVVPQWRGR